MTNIKEGDRVEAVGDELLWARNVGKFGEVLEIRDGDVKVLFDDGETDWADYRDVAFVAPAVLITAADLR